ncbi:tRNA-intron lyase [Candidatus Woesearchaeota archaeon]|nr:tRNA-intron lyase [Candidatus Woesearchaeota archaeon]
MVKKQAPESIHTEEFTLPSPLDEEDLNKLIPKAVSNGKRKEKVHALFAKERVITESSDLARDLYAQSRFGVVLEDGKVQLSLHESLYLLEKGRLRVKDYRNKELDFTSFLAKAKRIEPEFWIRYAVFKDMRNRGYIVKTALKFGADFRVYDRGVKPGEDHARWVVYPVHEGSTLTWYEFAAKNRVAHSTKKRLLIGVVDDEGDVSYWEIKWMRP